MRLARRQFAGAVIAGLTAPAWLALFGRSAAAEETPKFKLERAPRPRGVSERGAHRRVRHHDSARSGRAGVGAPDGKSRTLADCRGCPRAGVSRRRAAEEARPGATRPPLRRTAGEFKCCGSSKSRRRDCWSSTTGATSARSRWSSRSRANAARPRRSCGGRRWSRRLLNEAAQSVVLRNGSVAVLTAYSGSVYRASMRLRMRLRVSPG
jgi:hypothetical protein